MRIALAVAALSVYACVCETPHVMAAREAASRLNREGWEARPGKGSHTVYRKPGQPIVVLPNHRGDLAPGTLRSICAAAGWEYPPQR